jgi:hypothetical protein
MWMKRPHHAAGYGNLSYIVPIKGTGTKQVSAKIRARRLWLSRHNFYNGSRPVAFKPILVVE